MDELAGRTALVTGATGGLGRHICRALADEGVELGLTARSEDELEALAAELRGEGVRAEPLPADLTDRAALEALARRAEEALGGVDVLVNNAGVIGSRPYEGRPPGDIERGMRLNLLAPMLLTRLLLPGMLERGRGHVVQLSSLAGKAGPPYEEVYGATKAGLIGFTQSLRREYRGTGVSASVVCPGYVVEAGMYEEVRRETGLSAPGLVGRATPSGVADAVVGAIRRDSPEVIVNSVPIRPLLALGEISPRLGEWLIRTLRLFRLEHQRGELARERAEAEEKTGGPG